ncbi:hypothetical protein ACLOJK_001855 [Asimina triloba]
MGLGLAMEPYSDLGTARKELVHELCLVVEEAQHGETKLLASTLLLCTTKEIEILEEAENYKL